MSQEQITDISATKTMPHAHIWLMVAILTPLVLSISLSMDIYVPSLPMIIEKFHTTQQALQWTLSIYMFGVGIGQLCFGPLSDYLGRRRVVLTGIFLYLLGTLVCVFSFSISMLIMGRLLQSVGTCASLVVAYAVIRDLYDVKTSSKIYSFLNAATALGPVVAPLLGGFLQIHYGTWRASFIFLLGFAILSLLTTWLFLKETLSHHARTTLKWAGLLQRYRTILTDRAFIENSYYATVGMTILFVFCCISPYILITDLKASETLYGLAFSSNAITFILANVISTKISERYPLTTSIRLGTLTLLAGSSLMLIINALAGLSFFNFMFPMWLITAGAGLIMGPAVAIALEKFGRIAGTAAALINASQFVLAGLLGTLLMMHQAASVIPFACLTLVLGIFSLTLIYRNNTTNTAEI